MTAGCPLNVLVCAEDAAGIQLLKQLVQTEHRVVAVLTSSGDGVQRTSTVARSAALLGRPVLASALVKDPGFAEWVRRHEVDVLLNVHSLHVVAAGVLQAARVGGFNLHPGPLPRYAGLNSPSWAIYNGEKTHGVTVHWMEPEIDAGPIAYQASFDLTAQETGLSASTKCVRHGLPLVLGLLACAASDPESIPRRGQDLALRTYFGADVPQGGRMIWSQTADAIVRFVRACDYLPLESPWGHPVAMLRGREVAVARAEVTGRACSEEPGTVRHRTGAVWVAGGDQWVKVLRVQVEGRYLDPATILEPGTRLEDG